MKYKRKSHCMFLLKYHLILTVKYRHKLLVDFNLSSSLKEYIKQIARDYDFDVEVMEVDKNHIHLLLELKPAQCVAEIVKIIKSITTKQLWINYNYLLQKKLWGSRSFWTSGYFICTTGDASTETIKKYIQNQGKKT